MFNTEKDMYYYNNKIIPLEPPTKSTSIWTSLCPQREIYRIRTILKKRDPWDVFLLWHNINIDLVQVRVISKIIAKVLGIGTNALFIPNDSICAMTTDYDGSFIDLHIWHELEKVVFKQQREYNGEMEHGYYIDFLKTVLVQ
jgi:hypothetical protein